MKRRYLLLIAALALTAALCFLVFGGVCIGRIENQTDSQWSHIHTYLNGKRTVEFPVTGENQPIVFQYETGRGSFSAEITDAEGNVLYTNSSDESGNAAFLASSDLTLRLQGKGHGGVFSLTLRDDLEQLPDPAAEKYYLHGEGTHTGVTFKKTLECVAFDGKYVNFYVENHAEVPVDISINEDASWTIPGGEAAFITSPISATTLPQRMNFKCASEDGSDLNIYWKIAQRGIRYR